MEYLLNQSAWRRGWNDTKAVWTSWQFYVLDAVVAVVIGGVFEWYWGLLVVVFGMFCVWSGATMSAPIKQRNEVRKKLDALESAKKHERIKSPYLQKDSAIALIYNHQFYHPCREIHNDKSETHRIGVNNLSDKTIEGVEALLISGGNLKPEPLTSPLSPMHSAPNSPSSFTLNPTSDWYLKMYVDFFKWQPKTKTMQLCYHHNLTKKALPFHDTYKLTREYNVYITLGVTAKDTRIDTQWSAELSLNKYGDLIIDFSEVEVYEL